MPQRTMMKIESADKIVKPVPTGYDQAMSQMQRGSFAGTGDMLDQFYHHVTSSESSVSSANAPSPSSSNASLSSANASSLSSVNASSLLSSNTPSLSSSNAGTSSSQYNTALINNALSASTLVGHTPPHNSVGVAGLPVKFENFDGSCVKPPAPSAPGSDDVESDGCVPIAGGGHALMNEATKSDKDPTALLSNVSGPAIPSRSPLILQISVPPHPVAEFLYQLTKMLTDNNKQYIEWSNATIYVHDPPGLEEHILPKYFRHSNYSSFQRQMNYFGFRKIAGKGKMSPCSYVNEAAKEDISSLLFIKRKKTGSNAAAKLIAQQNRFNRQMAATGMNAFTMGHGGLMGGNPMLTSSSLDASAMGGLMGGANGMGAGGFAKLLPVERKQPNLHETALLREQQQMLAQLQQAHASATTAAIGVGTVNANAPTALPGLNFGGAPSVPPGSTLFDNFQGNPYAPMFDCNNLSFNPVDFAAATNANHQSLLMQQSAHAGGISQGEQDYKRIDSASNLRALLNHQISLFSSPNSMGFNNQVNDLPPKLDLGGQIQSQAMFGLGTVPAASSHLAQRASGAGVTSINHGVAGQGSSLLLSQDNFLRNTNAGGAIDLSGYLGNSATAQGYGVNGTGYGYMPS